MSAIALGNKTLYLNTDIDYIKDILISEYDIKSAGFSVIKYKKLLSEDIINELEKMSKEKRNIKIGKFMKEDVNLIKEVNATLAEVRKEFIRLNNLEEHDILSIKRDAIFVIKKQPTNLVIFDYFVFRPKDVFTSYMYIDNKEFYYSSINKEFLIKGLSNNRDMQFGEKIDDINYENEPLLKDIKRFMSLGEKLSKEELYKQLTTYKRKYVNRQLDKKTYRNLITGCYSYKGFQVKDIDDALLNDIDITYNWVTYIIPLIQNLL